MYIYKQSNCLFFSLLSLVPNTTKISNHRENKAKVFLNYGEAQLNGLPADGAVAVVLPEDLIAFPANKKVLASVHDLLGTVTAHDAQAIGGICHSLQLTVLL